MKNPFAIFSLLRLSSGQVSVKTAIRNFRKNWQYGSINIIGLAIAFATLILVSSYIFQETTYESFNKNADRIFRPTYHVKTASDFEIHFARIPLDYINELPNDIPEIETLIRFQNHEQQYLRIGDQRFKPDNAFITDPQVFGVFDLNLLRGSPNTALTKPNSIVLSESSALKYFSTTDVIGEEIIVNGNWNTEEKTFLVTGVMKDLPVNTHLPIDILFSFAGEDRRRGWAYVYTLLDENASIADVEAKIPAFIEKHSNPNVDSETSLIFQALPEIHLTSHLSREIKPNGQILYINIFFWVGYLFC